MEGLSERSMGSIHYSEVIPYPAQPCVGPGEIEKALIVITLISKSSLRPNSISSRTHNSNQIEPNQPEPFIRFVFHAVRVLGRFRKRRFLLFPDQVGYQRRPAIDTPMTACLIGSGIDHLHGRKKRRDFSKLSHSNLDAQTYSQLCI